ncbi:hypothetical protein [Paenibacillus alginolyticus]|jgi:hypothetical protein|nr:hypothetical protein [Paenibacillus alginolyticus]MEC0142461.1 hypothetical protein [Paenibacillus alginolyticus]
MNELKVTKDQIYKGNLLLVNKDHPVPRLMNLKKVRIAYET